MALTVCLPDSVHLARSHAIPITRISAPIAPARYVVAPEPDFLWALDSEMNTRVGAVGKKVGVVDAGCEVGSAVGGAVSPAHPPQVTGHDRFTLSSSQCAPSCWHVLCSVHPVGTWVGCAVVGKGVVGFELAGDDVGEVGPTVGPVVAGPAVGSDEDGPAVGSSVAGDRDGEEYVGDRVGAAFVGGIVGAVDAGEVVGTAEGAVDAGEAVGAPVGIDVLGRGLGAADGRREPSAEIQSDSRADHNRSSGHSQAKYTSRLKHARTPQLSRPSLQKLILRHRKPSPEKPKLQVQV